jgi:hypothetical protein
MTRQDRIGLAVYAAVSAVILAMITFLTLIPADSFPATGQSPIGQSR